MLSYPRWTSKFEIKPGTWVFVPSDASIKSGIEIKSAIEDGWTPPKNYYHLRNGGHVAALKAHSDNTCFIHLDIKDFFGSINKSRVTRCLKRLFGYSEARRITIESTVKHPYADPVKFILPFGFVQSPIIASRCLFSSSLGKHLNSLSRTKNLVVSVYMDDIIISMKTQESAELVVNDVKKEAEKSKFVLNEVKEEGPAVEITAFNIKLSHRKLKIEPERISKFINDYMNSESDNQRNGYRRYIASVNPAQSKLLY